MWGNTSFFRDFTKTGDMDEGISVIRKFEIFFSEDLRHCQQIDISCSSTYEMVVVIFH